MCTYVNKRIHVNIVWIRGSLCDHLKLNLSETRMKNQNSPYDRFFNSKMMAACVNA